MNAKRVILKQVILLAVLLFTASYQNCTPNVAFNAQNSSGNTADAESGNGGTYDGKPNPGAYVRYFTNGCSQNADKDLIGILQVDTKHVAITNDLCTALDYVVSFDNSRLDFSAYNRDFVGYNSAIFVAQSKASSSMPVDLWCSHKETEFGLDIVVRTDSQSQISEGLVYFGKGLSSVNPIVRATQTITVQKSVSAQQISVSSPADSLQAQVDLTSRSGAFYAGHVKLNLDGEAMDLMLNCRVISLEPAVNSSPSNILALYQLESGRSVDGSAVDDSSGKKQAGRLSNQNASGANYVAGYSGNALNFDGIDDFIDISSLASQSTGDFTVSMWVKTSANSDRVMFAINNASGLDVLKLGNGLCSTTGPFLALALQLGNNNCYDSGITLVDGAWHRVTLTLTGVQYDLYLDGKHLMQQTSVVGKNATDQWYIGMDIDGTTPSELWSGLIDEVVIWSTALSPAEISNSIY